MMARSQVGSPRPESKRGTRRRESTGGDPQDVDPLQTLARLRLAIETTAQEKEDVQRPDEMMQTRKRSRDTCFETDRCNHGNKRKTPSATDAKDTVVLATEVRSKLAKSPHAHEA